MEENNKLLEEMFKNSIKSVEENEFKAYLVLDEDFDLDADREDNNILPKVIVWPKKINTDGDTNEKFESIAKKIMNFTNNIGEKANPRIYVVKNDFEEFASWISQKFTGFVIAVNENDLINKVNPKYKSLENNINNDQKQVKTETITEQKREETITEPTIETQNLSSIPPINQNREQLAVPTYEQTKIRKRTPGFVRFPTFLLTIIAIASLGIFVGKIVYTYLSQS